MNKKSFTEKILQTVLFTSLVIILLVSGFLFHRVRGTARVINYAGIVRGGTQRLVKLESNKRQEDDLIDYLDGILDELQNGGDTYGIIKINDSTFQYKLAEQVNVWKEIKEQIAVVRNSPSVESIRVLLDQSESYYVICDKTVSIAESYSERLIRFLQMSAEAVVIIVILLGVIILRQLFWARRLYNKYLFVNSKTYLDPLTGVRNRAYFEKFFGERHLTESFCLIYIDLDHLKQVNDICGHEAGDEYIRQAAETIRTQFRSTDILFRIGGDEFILYLPGCREEVAERLLANARGKFLQFSVGPFLGSFSFGISFVPEGDKRSLKEILDESDKKMYEHKTKNKESRETYRLQS